MTQREQYVKIADLKLSMKNVNIHGIVIDLTPIRKVPPNAEVRTAVIGDPTGMINLALWNEYCYVVKLMDIIRIRGASVGEHKRGMTLSVTKQGEITKQGEFSMLVNDLNNRSAEDSISLDEMKTYENRPDLKRPI